MPVAHNSATVARSLVHYDRKRAMQHLLKDHQSTQVETQSFSSQDRVKGDNESE